MTIRRRITLNGMVQGVGFRPFVYRLARRHRLGGFVRNGAEGVIIEAEGSHEGLELFLRELQNQAPALSRLLEVRTSALEIRNESEFLIVASQREDPVGTLVSPDVATCRDCLEELRNPQDRRYRYPFINCTNCGPRYTILESIPYDRERTSMRVFPMCESCSREYHDPEDRRFHAQPNACPECGPRLWLTDSVGEQIEGDAVTSAVEKLRQGRILAVRGVGGFHLVVDATHEEAVLELRSRKGREDKPFALMAAGLREIRGFCVVGRSEAELLEGPARPIVLLESLPGHGLAASIAPGNRFLGFMLPYTPLHHLILEEHSGVLVMTSANYSEEPLAIENGEALNRLAAVADFFLLHDREILQRCDDSVYRVMAGSPRPVRRARGYVPSPVLLRRPTLSPILGCGAELKNCVALSRGECVFLSQHIGDLDNLRALRFFEESIEHLKRILEVEPVLVACDLHPQYLSTQWALRRSGLPVIEVQHHHAHLASLLAEHREEGPMIGVILDGTGFGADGTIWGGEVLLGDLLSFNRFAFLEPFPLPGGESAIRRPWKVGLALLLRTFEESRKLQNLKFWEEMGEEEEEVTRHMIARHLNTPLTSSCGRLFDGVAALMSVRREVNYEAQAAIELEMLARGCSTSVEPYASGNGGPGPLDWTGLIRGVVIDLQTKEDPSVISARFHRTVAEMFRGATRAAREASGINRVGLSGGVFQNLTFFELLVAFLEEDGFEVLTHREVPANDGGIALGQIAVADARQQESGSWS